MLSLVATLCQLELTFCARLELELENGDDSEFEDIEEASVPLTFELEKTLIRADDLSPEARLEWEWLCSGSEDDTAQVHKDFFII